MQIFGHWIRTSRLRLFVGEQAALGVLLLAVLAAAGRGGAATVALAMLTVLCLQGSLYLADLYELSWEARSARWLMGLGLGVLLASILWALLGANLPGHWMVALALSCCVSLLLREIPVGRHRRVLIYGKGPAAQRVAQVILEHSDHECSLVGFLDDARRVDEDALSSNLDAALAELGGLESSEGHPNVGTGLSEEHGDNSDLAKGAEEGATVPETTAALLEFSPLEPSHPAHPANAPSPPISLLGDEKLRLASLCQHSQSDTLVLASAHPGAREAWLLAKSQGVEVLSAADFVERHCRRVVPELLGVAELELGEGFARKPLVDFVQRLLDLGSAVFLLLLSAPILGAAMLAVRLDSPGPVFYRQKRVGRHGKPFFITKLRTMRVDAESEGLPRWATRNDSRVTRVGRFLRLSRIDELPQLFSVLRGDMSMVGPRPERPYFVEQLSSQLPLFRVREWVRPGVTGWAQISYPYGATVEDAKNKLEFDLYYVRRRSTFLNLSILFHTARTVLTGRGAR